MAATGFTPISLYYSTTASAVPTAGNLANGELALNIADMKLYAKNSAGTVTLLASNASTTGVDSLSFGSTGLTPSTATTGAITVAGTLATTNGGTGLTSFTSGGVVYASSTSALTTGSALTYDGTTLKNALTSSGVTPSANARGLLLDSSGNGGLTIATGATSTGNIFFADSGDTADGFIQYDQSGRTMAFGVAAAEQMRLTSNGLGIGRTPVAYSTFRVLDVAGASGAIQKWVHTGSSVQLQAYASSGLTGIGSATNHDLILVTNDTERARIDSSGNLLLGVTSSTGLTGTGDFAMPNNRAIRFRNAANSAYLNMIYVDTSNNLNFGYGGVPTTITFGISGVGEVSRFTSAGGFSVGTTANPGAGAIYATGNITAYYSSDIKFKENVRDIPDALATVNAIGGKLFDWTDEYIESKGGADGYFVQKADFGVVAQDVQKVFPIAVRTRDDGSLAVDYEKLGALAFAALVELTKRVEALETN